MKIEFISSEDNGHFIDRPEPAKNFIPGWYAKSPRYLKNGKPVIENGGVTNNSIKACMPFYDAMISGYVQKTWCDVYIEVNDEDYSFEYQYSRSPVIISHRDNPSILDDSFYPIEFTWKTYWMPRVPSGWSVMFTHPVNRIDLPFYSLSGIMDSDDFYHAFPGNYPFYLKKGFSGLIPAGTPMYQIIPIKREHWNSEEKIITERDREKLNSKIRSYFFSPYKRFFHKKKVFK